MAGSVGNLSRRLCRSLFSTIPKFSQVAIRFSTSLSSHEDSDHSNSDLELDLDNDSVPDASQELPQSSSASSPSEESVRKREIYDRPLENGIDVGVYKAIVVGQVGQIPIKKKLRSGMSVTLFSVGTGGIRNNRRPLESEDPRDYANRCAVQWHRVSIYPERLGDIAAKHALPGSIIYLEGNLETKIFTDPITGLVRRIREIAIRRNGRVVFLGNGAEDDHQTSPSEFKGFKGVGYY